MDTQLVRPLRFEGNLAYVPLTRGLEAVIDVCDAPLVCGYNWAAVNGWKTHYAQRTEWNGGANKPILMHRVLLAAPKSMKVDHEDGDGLNNRRANIRLATQAQNGWNRGATRANKSGVKGVYLCSCTGRWRAEIKANGVRIKIGRFDHIEEAAAAYAEAARKLHGRFAKAG